MATNDDEVQVGAAPDEEAEFYIAWGRENLKGEAKGIGDCLRQLLALSTALAGSAILFNSEAILLPFRILAVICFLACLGVSFGGIMPFEAKIDLDSPTEISEARRELIAWKKTKLKLAFFFLTSGLVLAGAGLLIGSWK